MVSGGTIAAKGRLPATGGIRARKRRLLEFLESRLPSGEFFAWLDSHSPGEMIDPLIAILCRTDEEVRWRAVDALGHVVARLADKDIEAGRIVVRRLMWSLNEESGGIGWGAPEAMAEILVQHAGLAVEYHHIVLSYLREDGSERWQHGNFLENEGLQRGLLWGVTRLRQMRPDLVSAKDIAAEVNALLSSADGAVRGMAVRCLGVLGARGVREAVAKLRLDDSTLTVWQDGTLRICSVGELAAEALARLEAEEAAGEGRCL